MGKGSLNSLLWIAGIIIALVLLNKIRVVVFTTISSLFMIGISITIVVFVCRGPLKNFIKKYGDRS